MSVSEALHPAVPLHTITSTCVCAVVAVDFTTHTSLRTPLFFVMEHLGSPRLSEGGEAGHVAHGSDKYFTPSSEDSSVLVFLI